VAGILDKKTRIMDAVVTESGRRQMSAGRLRIEYASLTDGEAFYEAGEGSAADDATQRIYFECQGTRRQDFITFETDDSGKLMGYPINEDLTIIGEDLFQRGSNSSLSDINSWTFVSGSGDFASLSSGIVTSSIDHFKDNYMLGSDNLASGIYNNFVVNPESFEYLISNSFPFVRGPDASICDIDAVECLFLDKRLSHIPNFKFLPPLVVEPNNRIMTMLKRAPIAASKKRFNRAFLGSYRPLGEAQREIKYSDVIKNLNGSIRNDPDRYSSVPNDRNLPFSTWQEANDIRVSEKSISSTRESVDAIPIGVPRERCIVTFNKTSEMNNIVMQMFEANSDTLKFKKLDVIDFGEFTDSNDTSRPNKHVFFAGKVFLNEFKVPVFVNLFTIILD